MAESCRIFVNVKYSTGGTTTGTLKYGPLIMGSTVPIYTTTKPGYRFKGLQVSNGAKVIPYGDRTSSPMQFQLTYVPNPVQDMVITINVSFVVSSAYSIYVYSVTHCNVSKSGIYTISDPSAQFIVDKTSVDSGYTFLGYTVTTVKKFTASGISYSVPISSYQTSGDKLTITNISGDLEITPRISSSSAIYGPIYETQIAAIGITGWPIGWCSCNGDWSFYASGSGTYEYIKKTKSGSWILTNGTKYSYTSGTNRINTSSLPVDSSLLLDTSILGVRFTINSGYIDNINSNLTITAKEQRILYTISNGAKSYISMTYPPYEQFYLQYDGTERSTVSTNNVPVIRLNPGDYLKSTWQMNEAPLDLDLTWRIQDVIYAIWEAYLRDPDGNYVFKKEIEHPLPTSNSVNMTLTSESVASMVSITIYADDETAKQLITPLGIIGNGLDLGKVKTSDDFILIIKKPRNSTNTYKVYGSDNQTFYITETTHKFTFTNVVRTPGLFGDQYLIKVATQIRG